MNGLLFVEYGLKTLVMFIAAGCLLATVILFGASIRLGLGKVKTKADREDELMMCVVFFFVAIFCGIIAVILFGLATTPWWL